MRSLKRANQIDLDSSAGCDADYDSRPDTYRRRREREAENKREAIKTVRDIGEIPPIKNLPRRDSCKRNFRLFCETYFAEKFYLTWSESHLTVIDAIQRAVLEGGLCAIAMPRGFGKTTLCEIGAMWAVLYGHREYVAIVANDLRSAVEYVLEPIKIAVETNPMLLEDFPGAVFPIRALEGVNQRAHAQLCGGELTRILWTSDKVVFPTIAGEPTSGSIIGVAGITGRVRGMKHAREDGTEIRPSLVLVDDPQNDESAASPTQNDFRERVLAGAVLKLAGPDKRIAGLAALTIIRPDDMAARILSHEKHPEWQGKTTKMVISFPEDQDLWDQYANFWRDEMSHTGQHKNATAFYAEHREEMDRGSAVAWPDQYPRDCGVLSAIQHAMNLRLESEYAFWAEYQNEPLPDIPPDEGLLSVDEIMAKVSHTDRGTLPIGVTCLTAFIDVHATAHYWCVVGWESNFSGCVVDYGTEPEQNLDYFMFRELRRTLQEVAPRAGVEGQIYAGLEQLAERILGREYRREDGAMMRVDRCLIDANWGQATNVVYRFCQQSKYAGICTPSHGKYVGASSKPMGEYSRKRGDKIGDNWRVPVVEASKRVIRHVVFDTNYWKSFVHARLASHTGDPGCLSLFKQPVRAKQVVKSFHRLFAEHLAAEYRVRTEGRGRKVDEWKLRVDGGDNHWLDCLVGSAVAASMGGVELGSLKLVSRGPRKRVSLREFKDRVQRR